MRALDLKLIRDVGKMKGQMLAVGLVMACGLAMMIMARSLILSLEVTRTEYYEHHRFADVFCDLKRAPNALRDRLAEIPGVAAVETRVMGSLRMDLPGQSEPADGTILSIPEDRPLRLNLLHLRTGRFPEPGKANEVLLSEAFATAHGFRPGDTLDVILRGGKVRLHIVGIALSPEYVFEARPGQVLPDNKRFGVFWMNERDLATAYDMDGAFNNVVVDVAPGTSTKSVMAELDRLLAPYGGLIAYDRRDHGSAKQLDDEIAILNGMSIAFPVVFLSIATFMTSAVLARVIRLQREQIAQMKAFGYSPAQVGGHYLKFALVIVGIGLFVGGIAGMKLGENIVRLYHKFFQFPSLTFHADFGAIGMAFAVSSAASMLGVLGAVRQAVKLPPAEAMRPEPPADFKPSLLERLGVQNLFGPSMRMALRNLERKPWQAFFTALGLALAVGIPIVPGAMRDGINFLLDFQWTLAQRQDVTVSLIEPSSAGAFSDLRHLPGVIHAEPFRSVPVRLRFGQRSHRLAVTGVPAGTLLNRALDAHGNPLPLPPDGLLISGKLAEMLDVEPGDSLRMEVQEGRRPHCTVAVQGLITDYAGLAAYMDIEALRRLLQEGASLNGAHLSVDRSRWQDFLDKVKEVPRIGGVSITAALKESFRKTTAESINLIQGIYFLFSIIVSFGVVYNSARIALSERGRDLATLRVVGFTNREVAGVLIGELAMLTLVAIPAGLWIGGRLANLIVQSASTETVRLPLILTHQTYATAVLIVLLSAGVSFFVVSRRIRNLNLLEVLKARE
ncbi:MAG: FtsX-like permease family protein [Chthoniobacterales bacterium]|nr:FtsX-like permease family protein [Chthoniobacterales bacterium]